MKVGFPSQEKALRAASVAALVALALMVWSFLDPSPLAMVVAMSVGQGLGTLSLLLFLGVVAVDIVRNRGSKPE